MPAWVALFAWPAAVESRSENGALTALNQRWAGARCRIRFDVPIKKGRDSDGWSKSVWIVPRTAGRKGVEGSLLKVSDRGATTSPIPGYTTPEGFHVRGGQGVVRGTAFIAEGWEYENPKNRSGLVLRLRFANGTGQARMSFRGSFGGKLGRQHAEAAESWARIELFEVAAADEKLVDVPAAAPETSPVTAPPATARPAGTPLPAAPTVATDAPLELRVLGVAVEPLRVAPGGQTSLVITYSVEGAPTGGLVEIVERRAILRSGERLTVLEARVSRAAGTHRSSQPLSVPDNLAAGILTFRGSVEAGSSEASAETLFEVASP